MPIAVTRAAEHLAGLGIWYRFGRNSEAWSCRDAAGRRQRLGRTGIPLWDELKSLALTDGRRTVLAHCRGDRRLDLDRVAAVMGTGPLRLAGAEEGGWQFGLVHPFVGDVAQVFDEELVRPFDVPGTVMTNGGDRTWSVEVSGARLAAALGAVVAPIAMDGLTTAPRPAAIDAERKLGIITGNAPEAGMLLWELVNRHVRLLLGSRNQGDVSMPAVEVQSRPAMGLSMELDVRLAEVREVVLGAATDLVDHGCTTLALACNTTQVFGPELQQLAAARGSRFLAMPEVLAAWLRARGVRSVGLVGIRFVSDPGPWGAYEAAFGDIAIERPRDRGLDQITSIGYQVKAQGPTTGALSRLHNVLRDQFESEHVVVALTELSTLLDLRPSSGRSETRQLIDPLRIYAEALAHEFVGLPFPS